MRQFKIVMILFFAFLLNDPMIVRGSCVVIATQNEFLACCGNKLLQVRAAPNGPQQPKARSYRHVSYNWPKLTKVKM